MHFCWAVTGLPAFTGEKHSCQAAWQRCLAEMPGSESLYTACRHGHCVLLPACLADCCSPAPCLPGNGLTSRL